MPTVAIRMDTSPKGVLKETEVGSSRRDEQMNEEQEVRQKFLDAVAPLLASLPERPLRRQWECSARRPLGTDVWSNLNHYLVLVTVDIGDPGVDLTSVLPAGAEVSVVGSYKPTARLVGTTVRRPNRKLIGFVRLPTVRDGVMDEHTEQHTLEVAKQSASALATQGESRSRARPSRGRASRPSCWP